MINYYEILKVPDFSSYETIKKNYKNLMLESHPDKGGDSDKFKLIREAYDLMKDDEKKKEYDNKLMYFQDMYDRAEEINLEHNVFNFKCIQCEKNNEIDNKLIKEQNNSYQYIIKCDGCSMIYKYILILIKK